jgi:hypothetical protein
MVRDPHTELELTKSIILDLERHLFGRGLATESVEISQKLLDASDAQRLLHPDLIKSFQSRVDKLRGALVKQAEANMAVLNRDGR